jgi:hypothetical protein
MVWYAASYTKTTVVGGSGHPPSLSCCLSATAIRFLAVLFPPRGSAFLTVGLSVVGRVHRTVTGFPCFALVRCDRCRASPLPRDRGALMADILTSAITAASQRRVLSFAVAFHLPKFWITRLTEIQVLRPSGLPFACDRWMEHRSLGFLPGFTPRRYQQRMPGAGTNVEHSLEANRRPFDPPFRLAHLHSATSRRTRISQTVDAAILIPRTRSSPWMRR